MPSCAKPMGAAHAGASSWTACRQHGRAGQLAKAVGRRQGGRASGGGWHKQEEAGGHSMLGGTWGTGLMPVHETEAVSSRLSSSRAPPGNRAPNLRTPQRAPCAPGCTPPRRQSGRRPAICMGRVPSPSSHGPYRPPGTPGCWALMIHQRPAGRRALACAWLLCTLRASRAAQELMLLCWAGRPAGCLLPPPPTSPRSRWMAAPAVPSPLHRPTPRAAALLQPRSAGAVEVLPAGCPPGPEVGGAGQKDRLGHLFLADLLEVGSQRLSIHRRHSPDQRCIQGAAHPACGVGVGRASRAR